jgi:hypothetical protein
VLLREKGRDPILRAPDDRPVPAFDYRPLHQPGPLQEQLDHGLRGRVIGRVQAKLRELRVLPHEVRNGVLELRDDPLQCRTVGLLLQVLDDVELDAQLLRDLYGSLGRVSIRVVEDRDRCDARDRTRRSG